MAKDKDNISQINDESFLQYKKLYWGWAVKNWSKAGDSLIEEVFFDAMAIFLEYERKGKVTVKPTTFIIGIAHKMFQKKRLKNTVELPAQLPVEESNTTRHQELIRLALQQLGEKCREILVSKYFYNLSMEDIMLETGAKSRSVVRTQKKRCMQKLKTIVTNLMKGE